MGIIDEYLLAIVTANAPPAIAALEQYSHLLSLRHAKLRVVRGLEGVLAYRPCWIMSAKKEYLALT